MDCFPFLGDFNADGRNEFFCVHDSGLDVESWDATRRGMPGDFLRCGAGPRVSGDDAVVDHDGDGYDDLQFGSTVFTGGPDGLSPARCTVLP